MTPTTQAIGALTIAIVCGSGGFFLGRHQNPAAPGNSAATTSPAGKLPSTADRRRTFTKTDLGSLRVDLDREQEPLKRFKLALQNLESWMNADPQGALAWLKSQQPSGRRDEVIRMALAQFAENNPKGASEWALENLSGVEFNNALIRICEAWARSNGLEAATWLNALPASQERDAAMEGAFFAWATEDPAAVIDYLKKNPGSGELSSILRHAAFAGWAKSDPMGAVSASLESSRVHQDPAQFANTLANWAMMDLAASSQWLLANVRDGGQRELAVAELAGIFANQSPEAGLTWIGKLNAGAEREKAVNQFAAEWANADAAAAAKWAANQTTATLSDEVISEILHGFLAEDTKAFDAWRATLAEGPLKESAGKVGAVAEDE